MLYRDYKKKEDKNKEKSFDNFKDSDDGKTF
jgi:hypothetical protein